MAFGLGIAQVLLGALLMVLNEEAFGSVAVAMGLWMLAHDLQRRRP